MCRWHRRVFPTNVLEKTSFNIALTGIKVAVPAIALVWVTLKLRARIIKKKREKAQKKMQEQVEQMSKQLAETT